MSVSLVPGDVSSEWATVATRPTLRGFDPAFYLGQYPKVVSPPLAPVQHYLNQGWQEGRDPSRYFSTAYYLADNPDVAAAGMNPLKHFWEHGFVEGRQGWSRLSATRQTVPRHGSYLARNLSDEIMRDCYFHNYEFLSGAISAFAFETLLQRSVVAIERRPDEIAYTVTIEITRDYDYEGEISLCFRADKTPLYYLSFTVVAGHVVGLQDQSVLLISRMQGKSGMFREIQQATKEMKEVSPQAMLFAVLEGIALATGVEHIAGICATNSICFSADKAELFEQAYDHFFISIGAAGPHNGFYICSSPVPTKPISFVKPGHRLRTKLKRGIKEGIAMEAGCWAGGSLKADSEHARIVQVTNP